MFKRAVIFAFGVLLGQADIASADSLGKNLERLVASKKGKGEVGISVVELGEPSRSIFEHNAERQLIPASVMKIPTTLAALKILGGEYRFKTELLVSREKNQDEFLYVRGHGDPSLISGKFLEAVQLLKARGLTRFKGLVVDDSLFEDPRGALGSNPYQAALSATSVNHNSYELIIGGGVESKVFVEATIGAGVQLNNRLKRGKRSEYSLVQRPLSLEFVSEPALLVRKAFSTPAISVELSGTIGADGETVYNTVGDPPRIFGGVLQAILESNGIMFGGPLLHGVTPTDATLIGTLRSKDLAEIVRDLNHYSNNFIAEQTVFALGGNGQTYSHARGVARLSEFVQAQGVGDAVIVDGSGLSRGNRLSAKTLSGLLVKGSEDISVAPDLLASLSRVGVTGTVKSRKMGLQIDDRRALGNGTEELRLGNTPQARQRGAWVKTGSLDGVSSLAGVVSSPTAKRYVFAIIQNGDVSKDFEDDFLRTLIQTAPSSHD